MASQIEQGAGVERDLDSGVSSIQLRQADRSSQEEEVREAGDWPAQRHRALLGGATRRSSRCEVDTRRYRFADDGGGLSGEELKAEVAEVRAAVVNEVNELGETALFTAADKGCLDILKELLTYSSTKTLTKKNHFVGLIGYGFQKEKRKTNTDLCYGFCALKGIDDLGWIC
nr:ankyrin repeat-containing protein itn1 [Quercus suber]